MLFLFLPLFWISQYDYPSGDDYHIAVQSKKEGALAATRWWYFNGSGRYSYTFVQSLLSSGSSWPGTPYWLCAILIDSKSHNIRS